MTMFDRSSKGLLSLLPWRSSLMTAMLIASILISNAQTIVYSNNFSPGDYFINPSSTFMFQPVGASGWFYNNVRYSGVVGITNYLPRNGNGSVWFEIRQGPSFPSSKADIEFVVLDSSGNPVPMGTLNDLTSLSYDWYRVGGAFTASSFIHPAIRVFLVHPTNPSIWGYLVYERVYQPAYGPAPAPTNMWVTETIGDSSILWSTGTLPGAFSVYNRTLAQWKAMIGNYLVLVVSSGVGSGWGTFQGAVDNISWTIGSSTYSFNFEPDPLSGMPVDLNGGYCSPSASSAGPGVAFASTSPFGFPAGQILEVSRPSSGYPYPDSNAQEATYTPFSDSLKPPNQLSALRPSGAGSWNFGADIELQGAWQALDLVGFTQGEAFFVGIHDTGPRIAGVIAYRDSNSFVLQLVTADATTLPPTSVVLGGYYDDTTGATRFRIQATVDGSGNLSASVTTLNGSAPNTTVSLGSIALPGGFGSTVAFQASFLSFNGKSQAEAKVSNFTTTAIPNVLYVWANDPYVKTSEQASYQLGMANLLQTVNGYQAFLSSIGAQTLVNLSNLSDYYTSTPFGTHILDPRSPTTPLDMAAGIIPGVQLPTDDDSILGILPFSSPTEGVARVLVDAEYAPGIPTRFSDATGNPVTPDRRDSNRVVYDNTAPTVSIVSAINNGQNVCAGYTAKQGLLEITVLAYDDAPGDIGSGLDCRPVIQLIRPDSTVITLDTYSWEDNQFKAEYTLTPSDPCGAWQIQVIATDNAGNQSTTTCNFNVNIAQITLNLQLTGVQLASGTITRGIRFTVGGTGGSNPPLNFCRNVTFSDPDGLGGAPAGATVIIDDSDGLVCGGTPTCVSAKDELHTLRKQVSLTNTGPSQFAATLALQGGDANNDNLIDILDFGVFAFQYSTSPGANTPCGTPSPHSDFSGNGVVATEDFTFIQTGFLSVGDTACTGNYLLSGGRPREKATIKELALAGVPYEIARSFDLDSDGWVTVQEIARWLNGERPSKR